MEIVFNDKDFEYTLKAIENLNGEKLTDKERNDIEKELLEDNVEKAIKRYTRKLIKRAADKVVHKIYVFEKEVNGINCIFKGKSRRLLNQGDLLVTKSFFGATVKYNEDLIKPIMNISHEKAIRNLLMNKLNDKFSLIDFKTEVIKEEK